MDFSLNARERTALEAVVAQSKDVRQLKRSQALLSVAAGVAIVEVARQLQVARSTIYNWADRFLKRTGPIADRLTDCERSGRPDTLFQNLLERVPALLELKPTDFGYRHAEWTVDLLQAHLRDEGIESSDASIRRALHESGYRWKRPRFVLRRRSETWRHSKGGSSAA
jgi:transposase